MDGHIIAITTIIGYDWAVIRCLLWGSDVSNDGLGVLERPLDLDFLKNLLKLPAWKVGDRGFEPRSGLQVLKICFLSAHL